jgi:preprotein translocase subunit SecG
LRYSGHWSERSFTKERGEEVGMSRNVIVVAIVVIVIVVFLYLILRLF